jgi:hypothetical protein
MTNKKRFQIREKSDSTDHFYSPDIMWEVIDTKTGEEIKTFFGRWEKPDAIQVVKFSRDGKEVLAMNGHGEIIERFKLPP